MVLHSLGKTEFQVQFLAGAPLDKHTHWIYNSSMYKVEWKDTTGRGCVEEVKDLSEALAFATELGIPVTINGGGIELVGTFGSAGVENGRLPNGDPYTWYKRRYVKK
jgi:hypothetical protein